MFSIRKFDESCSLTAGMAERLGVDIPGAMVHDPEMQAQAFRSAVLKCMTCKEQGACQALQDENAHLDAAPSYCRNDWG